MKKNVIWEESDIKVGMYYCRSPKTENIGYLASVTHKIGYLTGVPLGERVEGESCKKYISVSVTDGLTIGPVTTKQMADKLTEGGYEPIPQSQLIKVIEHLESQNCPELEVKDSYGASN